MTFLQALGLAVLVELVAIAATRGRPRWQRAALGAGAGMAAFFIVGWWSVITLGLFWMAP